LQSIDYTPARCCSFIVGLLVAAAAILPAAAQTGNTALIVSGPQDEPITAGGSFYYTPKDGTFTVTKELNPTEDGVWIKFDGSLLGAFWDVSFWAPVGQLLQVGEYENCQRGPSDTTGGIDISGFGTGCNSTSGSFIVHELTRTPDGNFDRFHISFQQSCNGVYPPLAGEIFYNSSHQLPPPPVPTPTVRPGQLPVISVSVSPKQITEGSDATFTFTAKPAFAFPTSIGITYNNLGPRLVTFDTNIRFGAGVSTHTVTLHTFADTARDKKQRFTVRILNVPIYKLGAKNQASVTIADPTH
jgi:hypothetical protein